MGHPIVYPTGATLYNPEKAWNGLTILSAPELGALLINMNGSELRLWKDVHGLPNKILPGGHIMGSTGTRSPKVALQDHLDLIQIDWDGKIVWKFDRAEFVEDPGEKPRWVARQHHDFQREGNPVGYYAPDLEPKIDSGNTLILSHKDVHCPYISDKPLLDDVIYEVSKDVKAAMEGLLGPVIEEKVIGSAEIRRVFSVSKVGTIAGSYITSGTVVRNASARLKREGEMVFEGKISSLKRFKDDVKEVSQGYECGIGVEDFTDFQEGDVLEVFIVEEIQRS